MIHQLEPSHSCCLNPTLSSRKPGWLAVPMPGRYRGRHTAGGNPPPRNNRFQDPELHRRAQAGRRASTPAVRTAAFHRGFFQRPPGRRISPSRPAR